jgi:hypothetical protein
MPSPYSPDPAAQALSSLTYSQTENVSTPTTLALVAQASANFVGSNKRNTIDHYLSFNPLAIAQVSTFTFTCSAPTAADVLKTVVTDGSASPKTRELDYILQAGDTPADIVEILLAMLNMNPYLSASTESLASPYLITVNSVIPGQAHTVEVTETGTSMTISPTTIATPASGVPNYGKIFTTNITASVSPVSTSSPDAYFQVNVDMQPFDGAQPVPASTSGIIALAPLKHSRTIKALRAARGV